MSVWNKIGFQILIKILKFSPESPAGLPCPGLQADPPDQSRPQRHACPAVLHLYTLYRGNPRKTSKLSAAFCTFAVSTWRARRTQAASRLEAGRGAVILPPSTSLEKNLWKLKSRDTGPLHGNILNGFGLGRAQRRGQGKSDQCQVKHLIQ